MYMYFRSFDSENIQFFNQYLFPNQISFRFSLVRNEIEQDFLD